MAASNAGTPRCVSSPKACAMPYIFRLLSMMTIAPLAGLWLMAHFQGLSQCVVAFDIGFRLIGKRQGLRSTDGRWRERFAVDEEMEQIQHMRLRWNAGFQRHLHGQEHRLLVVEDKFLDVTRRILCLHTHCAGLQAAILMETRAPVGER